MADGVNTDTLLKIYKKGEPKMNMGSIIALIKRLGGGGSVPKPLTYDYMPEGYPKKTSIQITWDGDTTDRPSASGAYYYIGTHEEVYNASGIIKVSISENGVVSDEELAENDINKSNSGFVVYSDYAVYCYDASETLYGFSFPCTGLFFANVGENFTSKLEITDITPMAEEFMPVLTSPNGTKYKLTVDDTGTLSATEVT